MKQKPNTIKSSKTRGPIYFILQQLRFSNPRVIQYTEKINTPTEMNFSSNPCIGNNDNPPIAPKITANGAVHAGHPGVNAAKAPPKIAEEFDFTEFIIFILFILNAINAKLIPAKAETAIVSPIEVTM